MEAKLFSTKLLQFFDFFHRFDEHVKSRFFVAGDTIGCGVNFVDKICFFTKNGINLGAVVFDLPVKPYYPTVGLQTPGETVEVPLLPFIFRHNSNTSKSLLLSFKY